MRLLNSTLRCAELPAFKVVSVSNGHPMYPEPQKVGMNVKARVMYVRDDEEQDVLHALRRVSANEANFGHQ